MWIGRKYAKKLLDGDIVSLYLIWYSIGRLLIETLRPKRLAILHAATPGSTELARDLEQCLETRSLSVHTTEKFRPGTPDFTPLIGKLVRLKIDVIVSGGFSPDHILML